MRVTIFSIIPILVIFGLLFLFLYERNHSAEAPQTLRVLTYSAFLNSWGPGPQMSQKFEEQNKIKVEFINGGDAGVLLRKFALFGADVILGLDQFAIEQRDQKLKFISEFVPIDWSPMSFIYRKSEIVPPASLDDLLDARFRQKISLADPRTSTPGLQFLLGILKAKGRTQGFEFLKKLKPNVAFVGSNWSASYGNFKKKQSSLVFSYVTSPIYHWTEDQDFDYESATLAPIATQVEYAAIPEGTEKPVLAKRFIEFLRSDEIQKLIMQKNYMLPIEQRNLVGTPFEALKVRYLSEREMKPDLAFSEKDIQEDLKEWQAIGF